MGSHMHKDRSENKQMMILKEETNFYILIVGYGADFGIGVD